MDATRSTLLEARQSAERALEESRTAARQVIEAGRAKVEKTGRKLGAASGSLGKRAGEQMGHLREHARRSYSSVASRVESRYSETRRDLGILADDVGLCIREHPAVAMSVAWSAGLVFGFLVGRCTRRCYEQV